MQQSCDHPESPRQEFAGSVVAQVASAVTYWSHGTPENKNATGEGGVNALINKDNSGGASLILDNHFENQGKPLFIKSLEAA